jgi:tRNA U38,U39,U40 pseudouridine synthase TruA
LILTIFINEMQGKKINGGIEGEAEWIKEVNDCLPENIRVLARYTLPSSAADFHAEMYCSQQVRT